MQTSIILRSAFFVPFLLSLKRSTAFRKAVGFSRLGQILDAFQVSFGGEGTALFCRPQRLGRDLPGPPVRA